LRRAGKAQQGHRGQKDRLQHSASPKLVSVDASLPQAGVKPAIGGTAKVYILAQGGKPGHKCH
jgi:hypothetical protein